MAILPPEIWTQIFFLFSSIDELANSSLDAWARVALIDAPHLRPDSNVNASRNTMAESMETNSKRALGLVSRTFYDLSRPIVLEYITLRNIDSLRLLVCRMKERSGLARIMSRYTRRIDIRMEMGKNYGLSNVNKSNDDLNERKNAHRLLEDVTFILKACPNLSYFTYRINNDSDSDSDSGSHWDLERNSQHSDLDPTILDILIDACPLLEVIRRSTGVPPRSIKLRSILPRFTKLRVLEISGPGEFEFAVKREPYELPLLHTLIGPIDLIAEQFHNVHLPSFNTFVYNRRATKLSPRTEHGRTVQFFQCHGQHIRSLDARHGCFHYLYMGQVLRHVRECVLPIYDNNPYSFLSDMVSLQTIGFVNTADSESAEELQIMTMVNITVYLLESIFANREERKMGNLKTIRILDDRFVRLLRQRKRMKMRLIERQSRGWSIVIEDRYGQLLVPPSL